MPRLTLIAFFCVISAMSMLAPSQSPPDEPQKFDPKLLKAPVAISTPPAEIPDVARRTTTSGACLVSLVVDVQGYPQNVHTLHCTDPMFEKNSVDATTKWRFKPARRISDDVAVPVVITVDVTYKLYGDKPRGPVGAASYEISTLPGASSDQPDAEGVYPLTPRMETPEIASFKSKEFSDAAYALSTRVECQVLLVLDAEGKPQSADAGKCDQPEFLRGAAVRSVMKSKYRPAKLNGKSVPVRLIIKLRYEGFGTEKK